VSERQEESLWNDYVQTSRNLNFFGA